MTETTNKILLGAAIVAAALIFLQSPVLAMLGSIDRVQLHNKEWSCPDADSDLAVESAPAKIGGTITNTGEDQTVQVQVFDRDGKPVGPPKMLDPDAVIVVPEGGSAKVTDVDENGDPEIVSGDGRSGGGHFRYQFL